MNATSQPEPHAMKYTMRIPGAVAAVGGLGALVVGDGIPGACEFASQVDIMCARRADGGRVR